MRTIIACQLWCPIANYSLLCSYSNPPGLERWPFCCTQGLIADMNLVAQVSLALFLSVNVVTIYCHGLLAAGPVFTACYYSSLIALLTYVTSKQTIRIHPADYLMLGVILLCGASAITLLPKPRDAALLFISLAAYPATRGLYGTMRGPYFVLVLAIVIVTGTIVTAYAFGQDSIKSHGRPLIFGQYDHLPLQLAILLAIALLSLLTTPAKIILVGLSTAIPIAVFAAAQVRFAFAALIGALILGAIVSRPHRCRMGTIAIIVVVDIFVGALWQFDLTRQYLSLAAESVGTQTQSVESANSVTSLSAPAPPATSPSTSKSSETPPVDLKGAAIPPTSTVLTCPEVNLKNSIEMRKQLYKEVWTSLPEAGLLGIGLGRFPSRSCIGAEPHNSILQAAIETGLLSGISLVVLIFSVSRSLWPFAKENDDALLALCVLSLAFLVTCSYGQFTTDGLLFVALGYGAS